MEFEIGTNVWKDATGVIIHADGKEQLKLETRDDGQLLLSADIYDANGKHVAKLNRNSWVFTQPGYDVTTQPTSLTVSDPQGNVLFAAQRANADKIKVHPCQFYTSSGTHCTVSNSSFRVGNGVEFSGCTSVGSGGIAIGDGTIRAFIGKP
jgi:hypothetical protein